MNVAQPNAVVVKRLPAERGQDTLTRYLHLNAAIKRQVDRMVREVFDALGGGAIIRTRWRGQRSRRRFRGCPGNQEAASVSGKAVSQEGGAM